MTYLEERLEEIKIYREAARYNFNLRSNATYINAAGCGAVIVFLAKNLLDTASDCFLPTIQTHYWLYFAGLVVIFALSAWVTAISNMLSNAYFGYMMIVRTLEDEIGIGPKYPPPKSWAMPFEFLTKEAQLEISEHDLRANVWNIANTFLAIGGMFALVVLSRLACVGSIFYLASAIYFCLIWLVIVRASNKPRRFAVFVLVVAVSVTPFVVSGAQRDAMLQLDPFSLSTPQYLLAENAHKLYH